VRHVDPSQWSQLDALVRTDKMNMGAVTDPGEAQRELARLVACQAELGTGVITGLDTEWWVERTSAGGFAVGHDPDRLDVVQIAVEDPRRKGRFCILVIQVTDWTADDWAQQHALRRIIISSVFIKAGVRVTQDIRRIAVYLGLSADESEQAICACSDGLLACMN
jgi:hypothetical protein